MKDVPLVELWTSETGGVVIFLASTLMVLDYSMGSSRRPRVCGTDHDRPVGHFTSDFDIPKSIYIVIKYILYYIVIYSAGSYLGI